jgi:hypothetical protein
MLKVTFDQKAKLSLIKGEEKTISCYVYDSSTFEPLDLGTGIPQINICKTDDTALELVGVVTDATMGKFDISVTAVNSVLLKEGSNQDMELKIVDGSDIDLELLSRSLDVTAALC